MQSGSLGCLHGGRVHLSAHPSCPLRNFVFRRHPLGLGQCASMSLCMREPVCLSVNDVCAHLLFCKGPVSRVGISCTRSHVCLYVAEHCGEGKLVTCLDGSHPLIQGEQGGGWGCVLCRQRECVMCHPFLPYIHTTTPAGCSAAVAPRPVVFQVSALSNR